MFLEQDIPMFSEKLHAETPLLLHLGFKDQINKLLEFDILSWDITVATFLDDGRAC